MDRIYQEKMVKTLTGLAEGFAELAGLLNEFLVTAWKDGTLMTLAETYGVSAAIIPQE